MLDINIHSKDLFVVPTPADVEIQSQRRQQRIPDDNLIGSFDTSRNCYLEFELNLILFVLGDLKRKDAAMSAFIEVFKRDWEVSNQSFALLLN